MAIKTYKKTDRIMLSNNFKVSEFACHGSGCCSTVKIDTALVAYLQKIRDHFGAPVTIDSGYRCKAYNSLISNAASKSKHMDGMAADISVKGVSPAEVAKYAESIGIKGIGLYEEKDGNFVHIDTRTSKAFWYGHAQAYRSTFGGAAKPKGNAAVKEWQLAAIADGYKLPSGADGIWGAECEAAAKKAIVKKRLIYTNKNLTRFVQKVVGVKVDGKCGKDTDKAIRAYQEKNNLVVDGAVGLNTYKKMLGV